MSNDSGVFTSPGIFAGNFTIVDVSTPDLWEFRWTVVSSVSVFNIEVALVELALVNLVVTIDIT